MSESETTPRTLDRLDEPTTVLLRRHGLLRNLVAAEVKEELLDPDPLDADAVQAAVTSYRQRNSLKTRDQLQAHLRRQNWSQADLQWHAGLTERVRRTSTKRFQAKAELTRMKQQLDNGASAEEEVARSMQEKLEAEREKRIAHTQEMAVRRIGKAHWRVSAA